MSVMRRLVAGFAVLALAACSSAGRGPQGRTEQAPTAAPATTSPAPGQPPGPAPTSPQAPVTGGGVSKVLTIVLENHGVAATVSGMPQLARLGQTYGQTSHYRALTHPSLPNYLAMAGGSTFGVRDDRPPSAHHVRGASVFDQAVLAGRTAKTYAEAMPANCALDSDGGYAVKHNPWAYFSDTASRAACAAGDVPAGTTSAGALHDDIAAGTCRWSGC